MKTVSFTGFRKNASSFSALPKNVAKFFIDNAKRLPLLIDLPK